jgi:hypothetical protein
MTAAAQHEPAPVQITFRDPIPADLPYVLSSWRLGWRLSPTTRRTRRGYSAMFDHLVRHGVLEQPDTRLLVGCCPWDRAWIWSWLCHTPGPVPVIHFGVVRAGVDLDPGWLELRRIGIFARMVAAIGVRDEVAYTFRPADRSGIEDGLLEAARLAKITAAYVPVDSFLRRRQRR